METKSVFATLNAINCNEHTETKDTGKAKLTYLSWAWAWAMVKQNYPEASYTIYENADGWNYFSDGRTCWVKTGVTINGLEHIEYLPVMDYRNASIPADKVTSFDVNKAIQRSLTKAAARHGLGLYIYAGEDLPDAADDAQREQITAKPKAKKSAKKEVKETAAPLSEANYWKIVEMCVNGVKSKDGKDMRDWMEERYGAETMQKFDEDCVKVRQAMLGIE